MAYYVKVKPAVRDRFLPAYITGTKAADGNIILFQSDLNGVDGLTLSDRAAAIGGALLTPQQAKEEIDGTCTPAKCYDPEEKENENPIEDEQATSIENSEQKPNDDKEESEVNND